MIDISEKKRVVIKVGSNILTDDQHQLDLNRFRDLVQQIAWMKKKGVQVIVVSSGAIVCGAQALEIDPQQISEKQASAAVGQVILMENYQHFFAREGLKVAQVLLTKDGLRDPLRAQLAKNTFKTLLDLDVIPVVNENDTVSVEEIKFSDNDDLSAEVSVLIEADLQIFLTDTDGLFNKDPKTHADACLVEQLTDISDELIASLSSKGSKKSRGGMKSKIKSAQFLLKQGIDSIITNGKTEQVLICLYEGEKCGTQVCPG